MSAFGASSCSGCGLEKSCGAESPGEGPLTGTSLVVAAVGYFCFPLGLALAGALLLNHGALPQLLGGAGGLGLGMIIAARVARLLCAGVPGGVPE